MKTNDLKKGVKILLAYGDVDNNDLVGCDKFNNAVRHFNEAQSHYKPWVAIIEDNMRGNTRMAKVFGFDTEIGSVYAHDMIAYEDENGEWQPIEHTPAQIKLKKWVEELYPYTF